MIPKLGSDFGTQSKSCLTGLVIHWSLLSCGGKGGPSDVGKTDSMDFTINRLPTSAT